MVGRRTIMLFGLWNMIKVVFIMLVLSCLIPFLCPLFLAIAVFVIVETFGLIPTILLGVALWFLIKDR